MTNVRVPVKIKIKIQINGSIYLATKDFSYSIFSMRKTWPRYKAAVVSTCIQLITIRITILTISTRI